MRAVCYWVRGNESFPYLPVKSTPSANGRGWFRRVPLGGRVSRDADGNERMIPSFAKLGWGFEQAEDQIYEVDLVENESGATYLNAPEDDGVVPSHVLVLVNIAPGFDGECYWYSLESREGPCPDRGRRYPYKGTCSCCGIMFAGVHPDTGATQIYDPFPPEGIRIIRSGFRLWGLGGSETEYEVRLVLMAPNTGFLVHRTGKIGDRVPADITIHWDGERLRVNRPENLDFPGNGKVKTEKAEKELAGATS